MLSSPKAEQILLLARSGPGELTERSIDVIDRGNEVNARQGG